MLANLVCSLIKHKRVTTTLAKAKAARSVAEKMVTLGKSGTLHDRRLAVARLHQERRGQNPLQRNRARAQGTQRRLHPHHQDWTSARATPPSWPSWNLWMSRCPKPPPNRPRPPPPSRKHPKKPRGRRKRRKLPLRRRSCSLIPNLNPARNPNLVRSVCDKSGLGLELRLRIALKQVCFYPALTQNGG